MTSRWTRQTGTRRLSPLRSFVTSVCAPRQFSAWESLDYKRLQYVVDRIVELSATRQVVVFTHNIWFAAELLSRFDKATANNCTYYGVAEANGTTGIVSRGAHPRWDTVSKLSGRINEFIQGAWF